ncbi:hypothetical protein ACJMK2_018227 [Sinanodonta woodiana]|uniref:Uncharacterized protein n=1 Tax=Sinanodonta woodiana TaxID=1069815 RepID=A0ABD3UGE0_SINWO
MCHSLCKQLERYLIFGILLRLLPSFKIMEVCNVNMKGVRGSTVDTNVRHDMNKVRLRSPDIVILLIGDTDINADTSPEVTLHRMVALHNKYRLKYIVLRQLIPRFPETLH